MTSAPSLDSVLSVASGKQVLLPAAEVVLLGFAALAVVLIQEIWILARHVNTITHEGAHAAVGSLAGRKVLGITLMPNADGLTAVTSGGAAGNVLFYFVGYLGPSLFGLGAAKLIALGQSLAVLWLGLLLLVGVLFVLRQPFSFVPVLITGFFLFVVVRYAAAGAQAACAYGVTWFLLLSGVRQVIDHGTGAADASKLREITRIGRPVWVWLWLAGTVFALAVGGSLLV